MLSSVDNRVKISSNSELDNEILNLTNTIQYAAISIPKKLKKWLAEKRRLRRKRQLTSLHLTKIVLIKYVKNLPVR